MCANRRARILLPEHRFKRPESVLVVVYTTGGEFLLLRRRSPSAFWQSVTGSLRWGESPLQAARRELYEETGIMAGSLLNDLRHTERFPIVPPWRSRIHPMPDSTQSIGFLSCFQRAECPYSAHMSMMTMFGCRQKEHNARSVPGPTGQRLK
ncbi:NUDIX domain-containing protein [endosymbiont of Ridgeia piscesae]|uniref:NUDIX domain n=1 Tax=endosymbiont of Ridgeia piscesae TaxID=54398 RepID=A0A0T5YZ65_9GAMM|nr:NUDIX domain-containing protein [endosymbiont of Ridgeia piscesae]KRT55805.1 NUDIX domain [endosymbiont of Ridgeia piscesae]KRT59304.1 dATP pyrophosphohydrolase [endosymbiont of Ridgeia piscesae]